MKWCLFLTLMLISGFCSFLSAQVSVRAEVVPKALPPQASLTLTLVIEYEGSPEILGPVLPPLPDFHMESESVSQSYQIQSGFSKSTKKYHYRLKAKKEGGLSIGPIKITIDGKEHKTEELRVEVSSRIKPPPSSPGGFKGFFSPFFEADPFSPFSPSPPLGNPGKKDLFVDFHFNNKKLYVGEMILLRWFAYLLREKGQGRIFNFSVENPPVLNDFWLESPTPRSSPLFIQPQYEEKQGKTYLKEELYSVAAFPLRSGTLKTGALKARFRARAFFPSSSSVERQSSEGSLVVLPLPEKGKTKFFTGTVGDFTLSAHVKGGTLTKGDPLIYKVRFKGQGHPRLIKLPALPFGPAWKVYDTTETSQFDLKASQKDFEVILIAREVGDLKIPPFELSTFDPGLAVYKTHILPQFVIPVTDNKKQERTSLPTNKKEVSAFLPSPQQPLEGEKPALPPDQSAKTPPVSQKRDNSQMTNPLQGFQPPSWFFKNTNMLWLLAFFILLVVFLVLWIRKGVKKSHAYMRVDASLKEVDKKIQKKQYKEASQDLCRLIYVFLSELTHPDLSLNTSSENITAYTEHFVPSHSLSSLIQKLPLHLKLRHEAEIKELALQLEKMGFSPAKETQKLCTRRELKSLKQKVVLLFKKMEKT